MYTYGTCQKECNKRTAAALENKVACVPLFSHQKRRTLMAVPQCAVLYSTANAAHSQNCGMFGKRCRNPYFSAFLTNPEANHKSVARFLVKKRHTNFTKLYCILFDVYRISINHNRIEAYPSTLRLINYVVNATALGERSFAQAVLYCATFIIFYYSLM